MPAPAPIPADAQLLALISAYKQQGLPVQVSFRDLLKSPSPRGRATHNIHPYPARLLLNIPAFFLSTDLSAESDVVLDPFCGSGTVLLEALLQGRNALGADSNPLARLITSAKVNRLNTRELDIARRRFFKLLPHKPRGVYPNVINLDRWFYPHVSRDILRLLETTRRIIAEPIRDFFRVALSACIKDVSLADPRLSVPVRLKPDQYPTDHPLYEATRRRLRSLRTVDVIGVFTKRLNENINRADRLATWPKFGSYLGLFQDARQLTEVDDDSVDLVITSPPYLGAQKYIRASSLSLTWLGLCEASGLRAVEDANIGREHYRKADYERSSPSPIAEAEDLLCGIRARNPLRAHIAANYLVEMGETLCELQRVLKPGKYAVLIAGASRVCGTHFPIPSLLSALAKKNGLALKLHLVDPIRSRALMTKRHHTAGRIDAESVLLFRKET